MSCKLLCSDMLAILPGPIYDSQDCGISNDKYFASAYKRRGSMVFDIIVLGDFSNSMEFEFTSNVLITTVGLLGKTKVSIAGLTVNEKMEKVTRFSPPAEFIAMVRDHLEHARA